MLFQPPRSEFTVAGGDLETLYLEEIDVSDSHAHNFRLNSEERGISTLAANCHDEEESAHSRQTSFTQTNRSIRIFPPNNILLPNESSNTIIHASIHQRQSGSL